MPFEITTKTKMMIAKEFLIFLGTIGVGCLIIMVGIVLESSMTEKIGIMTFIFGFPLYLCFRLGLWWFHRCNRYPL